MPGRENGTGRAGAYGAFDAYVPALKFHGLLHRRESDAGALASAGMRPAYPVKVLEPARQYTLRNQDPGVADVQPSLIWRCESSPCLRAFKRSSQRQYVASTECHARATDSA